MSRSTDLEFFREKGVMVNEEKLSGHSIAEPAEESVRNKSPVPHLHSSSSSSSDDGAPTMAPLKLPPTLQFGPFKVRAQVFHISDSQLSYGLVNLKPLLPGHTLICPVRPASRLSQLTVRETADLFLTVRRVSRTLERVYSADAFNVAVQDGVDAGQSVPHVHVHIVPRRGKDMDDRGGGDVLYEMMDGEEGDLGGEMVEMWRRRRKKKRGEGGGKEFGGPDGEEARVSRSDEEMRREAEWLRGEMERDEAGGDG